MRLKDLLGELPPGQSLKAGNREIAGIRSNSKLVQPGDLFVAVKGEKYDGHNFLEEALRRGAVTVVLQEDRNLGEGVEKIILPSTRTALAELAERFYRHPSRYLRVIGITGTNGKTTVSYLAESILKAAGFRVGVVGTISHRFGGRVIPARHTTPHPVELQAYLAEMVKDNIDYCLMEVSSHGLHQERVRAIDFRRAVFTNLSPEHLDYHKNLEDYFEAKCRLFENLGASAFAVINISDEFGRKLFERLKAAKISYGGESDRQGRAEVTSSGVKLGLSGSRFQLNSPKGAIAISSALIGTHNISNILAASALAISEGISLADIQRGVTNLKSVPGRLEELSEGQEFRIFIDYAHTPQALEKVLSALSGLKVGKLISVFGCGGDRDRKKRPLMGRIATLLSDEVIITTDNPRSEEPGAIIAEILKGAARKNYRVIMERGPALREALRKRNKDDIVLIAGKGHESYQIVGSTTIPFDDRQFSRKILRGLRRT